MTQSGDDPQSNTSLSVVAEAFFVSRSTIWLCLLALTLAVTAVLGWRWLRLAQAPPGALRPVVQAVDKSYGVTVDLTGLSPEEREAALTRMQALGLKWVRQRFPWSEIEPAPGEYDWERWDDVVAATGEMGIGMVAVLDTTPGWANPAGSLTSGPPQELEHFGQFAGMLAARYAGQIRAYQIWDEPNLSSHWGERFVEPSAYARLLREATINIRQVDAQAVILTAALAPTTESGPLNLSDVDFLSQLYAANGDLWFDVVAAQPYGFTFPPNAAQNGDQLNFARVALLRQVMVANGDEDKAIWLTAFGWSAGGPKDSPWPDVTPEQQEQYTRESVQMARAQWSWLGPILFPTWDAALMHSEDPGAGLALVEGEALRPPALALESLDVSGLTATPGAYPADHPSGVYEGAWRSAHGRADVPVHGSGRLLIRFEGTRLDLDVQRGAYKGFLYVSVDDQPANALPQQNGKAYLVLYDPLEAIATVTLARHMADEKHLVVIETDGGWYQWPVLGWRVSREAPVEGSAPALIVSGVLMLVVAFVWVRSMNWRRLQPMWTGISDMVMHCDWRLHLGLLGVMGLGFFLVPGTVLSALMAVPLFLLVLMNPAHGLLLVAVSLPFFLAPKHLVGRSISMPEVGLLLVAAACVVRRGLAVVNAKPRALDWLAWGLAGLALVCAVLTIVPVSVPGLQSADWATAALLLLPPAGVSAALAGRAHNSPAPGLGGGNRRQLDVAVVGLTGLGLVSALAAANIAVAFHEFHVVFLDAAAFYALIRLLGPRVNPGESRCSWRFHHLLVAAFVAGATLMAAYAIYQFFFTDKIITAEGVRRALGVYGSPNNLALLLGRSSPILLALTAFSGDIRRRPAVYAVMGAALVLNLVALGLTFSRGALLVGLPAALLFLLLMRRKTILAGVLAALAAAVGGILPVLGTERLQSLLDTETGTGFFRRRLWQSATTMMIEHPWLGVGPDNFLYAYRTRYILPDAWQEPNLSHPHNIVLDFGARLGVGGIVLLVWFQVSFWRLAVGLYRRSMPGLNRALVLGLMASMVATLAHGLVDNSVFLVDLAFVFLLTLAVVANLVESEIVPPAA